MTAESDDPRVREEEDAAAEEAGRIGGRSGMEDVEPGRRAVEEAGGGVAEGFEQAEERLEENATHGDGRHADPQKDAGEVEEGTGPRGEYGEADQENLSD